MMTTQPTRVCDCGHDELTHIRTACSTFPCSRAHCGCSDFVPEATDDETAADLSAIFDAMRATS